MQTLTWYSRPFTTCSVPTFPALGSLLHHTQFPLQLHHPPCHSASATCCFLLTSVPLHMLFPAWNAFLSLASVLIKLELRCYCLRTSFPQVCSCFHPAQVTESHRLSMGFHNLLVCEVHKEELLFLLNLVAPGPRTKLGRVCVNK